MNTDEEIPPTQPDPIEVYPSPCPSFVPFRSPNKIDPNDRERMDYELALALGGDMLPNSPTNQVGSARDTPSKKTGLDGGLGSDDELEKTEAELNKLQFLSCIQDSFMNKRNQLYI